ncbi:conserved hypothetical protein [Ricinus communis]|uniref:Uncharacterized protein n=1 Tax=Ricinus communis TaxID=3988 RepID=B9RRL4_RICCO|nr:conserved hypothetical protein [Ricinus communis]
MSVGDQEADHQQYQPVVDQGNDSHLLHSVQYITSTIYCVTIGYSGDSFGCYSTTIYYVTISCFGCYSIISTA